MNRTRQLVVGGVTACVAGSGSAFVLAAHAAAQAPSTAVNPANVPPALTGHTADRLRGVGEQAFPGLPNKTIEADLHPIGYYPSCAAVTGAVFLAQQYVGPSPSASDSASATASSSASASASASATPSCPTASGSPSASSSASNPDVQPSGSDSGTCTEYPENSPSPADTAPGAEGCYIENLNNNQDYQVSEPTPPVGFAPASPQYVIFSNQDLARKNAVTNPDPFTAIAGFANRGLWRPVILTKTGAKGAALPGATFHLCAASSVNNPVPLPTSASCPTGYGDLGAQTTDANGKATWPYALPGSYSLVETGAPNGYQVNPAQNFSFPVSQIDADPVNVLATDALIPSVAPSTSAAPAVKRKAKVRPSSANRHPVQPTRHLAFTGMNDGEVAGLLLIGTGLVGAGAVLTQLYRRRSN